jgi:hypothetical protein
MAKKSFRSVPRIVSGRDNDRYTLLIRLVSAICFSLQDTGVSGAGKKPRQEVRCRDGHSDVEKHPGKHTLRAAFTEGEGDPATTNATRDSPRAIVLVNAFCRRLTAFSQGDWPLTCANADASRARIGIRKGNLSPDLVGRDGERREPKVEVAASRREAALELHEYAQSPVAESRMLSASSDQPCCHFPSLLVGEESSESRLLILLMGKKPAKSFKEKCFTF